MGTEWLTRIDARQHEAPVRAWLRDRRGAGFSPQVAARVAEICEAVRAEGDAALVRLERELDWGEYAPESLRVSETETSAAYREVPPELLRALRHARDNVHEFHRRERQESWQEYVSGVTLGSRVRPLRSAGIYVPAGQAPLFSTVYMCAIPAQVAGVPRLALCTPPRADGTVEPLTLVAARECEVEEVYRLGGAQAIAALAYGTQTVRAVDKIVGPGNPYVTLAKKYVYGTVGIESLAGPSEAAIIADDSAPPAWVAADLLAQAEHTGDNTVVLLTPSEQLAEAVLAELPGQVARLGRAELIERSLREQGALVLTRDLAQAAALASELAPEHLQLMVAQPAALAEHVDNAGCLFLGPLATVALGDYTAGPSHVLPTAGTARFSSPLSVQDFLKRTSLIEVTEAGLRRLGPDTVRLAEAEGLTAHAEAVRRRLTP